VYYVDVDAAGWYAGNIKEEDMVLSKGHYRFIVA
jgi:hypothetical protein